MNKTKSHFNWLRRLAIAALVCTLLLLCIIFYESTLNQDKSKNVTNFTKNLINTVLNNDEIVVPESIRLDESILNATYFFVGEKVKLDVLTYPDNADKSVNYSFSHDLCSVDEEGYFICNDKSIVYDKVYVTVTSKLDPTVTSTSYIYMCGIAPNSNVVERTDAILIDYNEGSIADTKSLSVGKQYRLSSKILVKEEFRNDYTLIGDYQSINSIHVDYFFDGDIDENDYYFLPTIKSFTFLKPCEGVLTIKHKRSLTAECFEGENATVVIPIKAVGTNDYVPTEPIPPMNLNIEEGEYVFNYDNNLYSNAIYPDLVEDKNTLSKLEYVDPADSQYFEIVNVNGIVMKRNQGEYYVNLVSILNPELKTKIKIVVNPVVLPTMQIMCPDNVGIDSNIYLKLDRTDNARYWDGDVTWSIVEGENLASIENGILSTKGFGTVKIRVAHSEFPEIYHEKTVTVKLWGDFYTFVRKIIGHFGMFFVLGIGFAGTYFLFLKRRSLTFILTPFSVGVTAFISEVIQFYTEGRTANVSDMIIDFVGGFLGLLFAMGVVGVVVSIWYIFNNKNFKKLQRDFKLLYTKNIFKKMP